MLAAAFLVTALAAATPAFRDCADCPEMVAIPAGTFAMGSSEADKAWTVAHGGTADSIADESPRHAVTLRAFAIGKYPVTRAEYAAFVRETAHPVGDGCHESSMPDAANRSAASWHDPGFPQGDRDPAVCVSWRDAQAYVAWLNRKTGGGYRLPTEAEWEYAARGGTTTRFWWGDDDADASSDAWYRDNAGGHTHPVGEKPANPFGLHDAVGNVWQLTEDCYAETYQGAPSDGSANAGPDDCLRVDRGGSFLYRAWLLRSATRERNPPDFRAAIIGFRVAKTLPAKAVEQPPAPRVVELKTPEGTILKGTYFPAAKPGPGALLLHQVNRTRTSWDEVARRLAAAGIHTLTMDLRGHGDSVSPERPKLAQLRADVEIELKYLGSLPGVQRDVLGVGGAGVIGVENAIELARHNPGAVKSLVLMSGETSREGRQFLHDASGLPELFVASDDDEYPPIVEAMELLYVTATNPGRKLVHYVAAKEAPWLWYETSDPDRVLASGGHGTDLFERHPDLRDVIVQWFTTTLVETPGRAPANTVASGGILNLVRAPGGIAAAKQQLLEARRRDPRAQLWPEVAMSTLGQGDVAAGVLDEAIAILELNLLAYPDSADAHGTLADAYLKAGRRDDAIRHAERALRLLESRALPASSWTDTEAYRGEIRNDARRILQEARNPQR